MTIVRNSELCALLRSTLWWDITRKHKRYPCIVPLKEKGIIKLHIKLYTLHRRVTLQVTPVNTVCSVKCWMFNATVNSHIVLCAEVPHSCEIAFVRNNHTCFPLNWLHHESCHVGVLKGPLQHWAQGEERQKEKDFTQVKHRKYRQQNLILALVFFLKGWEQHCCQTALSEYHFSSKLCHRQQCEISCCAGLGGTNLANCKPRQAVYQISS